MEGEPYIYTREGRPINLPTLTLAYSKKRPIDTLGDLFPKIKKESRNRLRDRVYARDGHRCVKCGSKDDLTLDHIFPRSKGGKKNFKNLQTMCRKCNSEKGDSFYPEGFDYKALNK